MINKLKDCQKTTLIGQLPDIINSNNQAVENEFNWIFDSSLNRLTKSVYAPTGSVKSHFGEFTNLSCEYVTIKNVDSLKETIYEAVKEAVKEELNINSVILDPNNGERTYSRLVMNGLTYGPILSAPTNVPSGKIFDGWYNGDTLYTSNTIINQNEDLNLQAKWQDE